MALVPGVFQLGGGEQPLEARYRARDRIEAVRCIWATADINALAHVAMLREDYDTARMWAEYLAVEMNADKPLLADAAQLGIDEARVRSTPPFPSTVVSVQTTLQSICAVGSLPAVAHAVAVEWHWARNSVLQGEQRAKDTLGREFIRAIAAHPELNQNKEHSSRVVEIAHRLATRRPDGIPLFFMLLRQTSALLRAYFGELYMFGGIDVPARQPEEPPRGRQS